MESDEPRGTPACKLERRHTLVARRIIDRNRSHAQALVETKAIDQELLDAAKALEEEYWYMPDYNNMRPNSQEAFREAVCDSDVRT
jgi:hypothetical protein